MIHVSIFTEIYFHWSCFFTLTIIIGHPLWIGASAAINSLANLLRILTLGTWAWAWTWVWDLRIGRFPQNGRHLNYFQQDVSYKGQIFSSRGIIKGHWFIFKSIRNIMLNDLGKIAAVFYSCPLFRIFFLMCQMECELRAPWSWPASLQVSICRVKKYIFFTAFLKIEPSVLVVR